MSIEIYSSLSNMLDTNVNSQSLIKLCKELNLTQVIKSPARITTTSESLIDVILVSNPKLTKSSSVIKTLISDHYPVFISLKLKAEKTRPQIIATRSYRNQWRSQPDYLVPLCKFQIIIIIHCFRN